MAGAAGCPLKTALLRRLAEGGRAGAGTEALSCAAFEPGFADGAGYDETAALERPLRPN